MVASLATEQYLRIGNLKVFNKIGLGRDYTGLRVKFVVERTSESTANVAKINIFNLNPQSRTFLEGEDMSIQLEAGYPGAIEIIASGNITKAISVQKHPDWITTIESGDGQKELRNNHLDLSFSPGTPFQAILTQAVSLLGVAQGPSAFAVPDIAVGGFSFSVTAKELIDKLSKRFGLEWSIQNGAVQISTDGVPVPGLAILISSTTGLIGNVVKRDKNIEFMNLLNGELIPGRLCSIRSLSMTGAFKIRKTVFDGDTHDGPWFAKVEAEPL